MSTRRASRILPTTTPSLSISPRSGCGVVDHAEAGKAHDCRSVLERDRHCSNDHVRHSDVDSLAALPLPPVSQWYQSYGFNSQPLVLATQAQHHGSFGSRRYYLLSSRHLQCHHKVAAGALCRYIKCVLAPVFPRIFIVSDNLFDLQVQWQGSAVHRALQVLEGGVWGPDAPRSRRHLHRQRANAAVVGRLQCALLLLLPSCRSVCLSVCLFVCLPACLPAACRLLAACCCCCCCCCCSKVAKRASET